MFADLKMICTFAPPLKNKGTPRWSFGEVAEWSIAAVLKTVVLKGTRGSNPCLSEIKLLRDLHPFFTPQNKKFDVFTEYSIHQISYLCTHQF